MHIPDGFLDTKTWVSTYALSAGALAYSIKKSKEVLEDKLIPKLGIMAAFIFAAQMVNFPIAGGTSGHLLGAALATVLLGPVSGCLILSTVLVIQCLAFQDGGLTALGGNIFNMAVLGVITAYLVYSLLAKVIPGTTGRNISIFLASWSSVVVAAFGATVELAASNTIPFSVAFPAMIGIHMLIGIGEGLITVAVVNFVEKVGFVDATAKSKSGVKTNV
ncbi:energy-coupling factor ABC transporter permease [Desulfotruncus alcoholivorax]|uniref:energy-coupling factor ABC transporter permease n=1 Tax=Desulfotruncus alcoholivorax TaxID=265477 RepID=UPI0003F921A8|nr:energy-coupling factor ABC transporter permease [Desulfotruncus alcoholivorax]